MSAPGGGQFLHRIVATGHPDRDGIGRPGGLDVAWGVPHHEDLVRLRPRCRPAAFPTAMRVSSAAVGRVGAVGPEDEVAVEIGRSQLGPGRPLHRPRNEPEHDTGLSQGGHGLLGPRQHPVLLGHHDVVGQVKEVLGVETVELVIAGIAAEDAGNVSRATCGSVSPAEVWAPMSAGMP